MVDSSIGLANARSHLPGGIVSLDPIVTYTRGEGGRSSFGVAAIYPELFRKRRALHFVGFAHTADRAELKDWHKRKSPLLRNILFYMMIAAIPIVVFGLLLWVARS